MLTYFKHSSAWVPEFVGYALVMVNLCYMSWPWREAKCAIICRFRNVEFIFTNPSSPFHSKMFTRIHLNYVLSIQTCTRRMIHVMPTTKQNHSFVQFVQGLSTKTIPKKSNPKTGHGILLKGYFIQKKKSCVLLISQNFAGCCFLPTPFDDYPDKPCLREQINPPCTVKSHPKVRPKYGIPAPSLAFSGAIN